MSFVFPFLLGSLALIGIPVLIHLIMRQKPKKLPFPAFRFLLKRQRTNLRKLRLRHLALLALRILLIAAVGLALARPKVYHQGLNIRGDQPMAAVLVFDTSASMEFVSGKESRLDEAKKRGLDLLDQLPDGSQVAILDSGDLVQTSKTPWYRVLNEARERIGALQLKPANAPVSQRLESAFRFLADLARTRDDERVARLPRILFVFSDRTRASWDGSRLAQLRDASDQVPPTLAGLKQAREDSQGLTTLLAELRQQIPPSPGQDYPDQALGESLAQLKDAVPRLTPEDLPPDSDLGKVIDGVRRRARELSDILLKKEVADAAKDYRDKLLTSLHTLVRNLAGAQAFFVDVGLDQPSDLAVLDLALPTDSGQPRQLFSRDENFVISALVQATGKEDLTGQFVLQVGGKTFRKQVDVKAGERATVPFAVNCQELKPGHHAVELNIETRDNFLGNNVRYLTFAIREPRRILVLADEPQKAADFVAALKADGFVPKVVLPADFLKAPDFAFYQAAYFLGMKAPPAALWSLVEEYVHNGGNVGVIPGGQDMAPAAYNQETAQEILPGAFLEIAKQAKPASWDFKLDSAFQHPLLQPFGRWRNDKGIDFILLPRHATRFWAVKPHAPENVLVSYAEGQKRPALLERTLKPKRGQPGKVLLFTTPLDNGDGPTWNNYQEKLTSFYLVLTSLSTRYLAGDEQAVQLNFIAGQTEPRVSLPVQPRFQALSLQGPEVLVLSPPKDANELVVKQALKPGNYMVTGKEPKDKFTARFSVNLPAEECDLTRAPVEEIEAVLGQGSVLAAHRPADIREILHDYWSEPLELFPPLMVLLLLVLAVENLLANKFYRKDNAPTG